MPLCANYRRTNCRNIHFSSFIRIALIPQLELWTFSLFVCHAECQHGHGSWHLCMGRLCGRTVCDTARLILCNCTLLASCLQLCSPATLNNDICVCLFACRAIMLKKNRKYCIFCCQKLAFNEIICYYLYVIEILR